MSKCVVCNGDIVTRIEPVSSQSQHTQKERKRQLETFCDILCIENFDLQDKKGVGWNPFCNNCETTISYLSHLVSLKTDLDLEVTELQKKICQKLQQLDETQISIDAAVKDVKVKLFGTSALALTSTVNKVTDKDPEFMKTNTAKKFQGIIRQPPPNEGLSKAVVNPKFKYPSLSTLRNLERAATAGIDIKPFTIPLTPCTSKTSTDKLNKSPKKHKLDFANVTATIKQGSSSFIPGSSQNKKNKDTGLNNSSTNLGLTPKSAASDNKKRPFLGKVERLSLKTSLPVLNLSKSPPRNSNNNNSSSTSSRTPTAIEWGSRQPTLSSSDPKVIDLPHSEETNMLPNYRTIHKPSSLETEETKLVQRRKQPFPINPKIISSISMAPSWVPFSTVANSVISNPSMIQKRPKGGRPKKTATDYNNSDISDRISNLSSNTTSLSQKFSPSLNAEENFGVSMNILVKRPPGRPKILDKPVKIKKLKAPKKIKVPGRGRGRPRKNSLDANISNSLVDAYISNSLFGVNISKKLQNTQVVKEEKVEGEMVVDVNPNFVVNEMIFGQTHSSSSTTNPLDISIEQTDTNDMKFESTDFEMAGSMDNSQAMMGSSFDNAIMKQAKKAHSFTYIPNGREREFAFESPSVPESILFNNEEHEVRDDFLEVKDLDLDPLFINENSDDNNCDEFAIIPDIQHDARMNLIPMTTVLEIKDEPCDI